MKLKEISHVNLESGEVYDSKINGIVDPEFMHIQDKDTRREAIIAKKEVSIEEGDFVKLYNKHILKLTNLTGLQQSVLILLAEQMDNNNQVVLCKLIKERMATVLNTREQSIRNTISDLSKLQFLERKGQGIYVVSPYLFGKVKGIEILKIRKTYTFDCNGVTETLEIKRRKKR